MKKLLVISLWLPTLICAMHGAKPNPKANSPQNNPQTKEPKISEEERAKQQAAHDALYRKLYGGGRGHANE
jgi:hypothetical protein